MPLDPNKRIDSAQKAASCIFNKLPQIGSIPETAIILGTGWGEIFKDTPFDRLLFEDISGFENLNNLSGRKRAVLYGDLEGVPIFALSSRIHLYEGLLNQSVHDMVRLQTEMLIQAGVTKLIITCGCGSLPSSTGNSLKVGDVVVVKNTVTSFAPSISFLGDGEYFSAPNDSLDPIMQSIAVSNGYGINDRHKNLLIGKHVMLPGPYFEGIADKHLLATQADVVGMSGLPELLVASLYKEKVKVLFLCFVTNDHKELHSDKTNIERGKQFAVPLYHYLTEIVAKI